MDQLKVLLIDDEQEFTSALAERLDLRGIRASTASSGEEALRMIARDPPGVVILDMMMPGLSGEELLARIREIHPNVGVIFLTGHGVETVTGGTFPAGGDYLMKPVKLDELMEKIRAAAERAAESVCGKISE